jgi:hypothetical protein
MDSEMYVDFSSKAKKKSPLHQVFLRSTEEDGKGMKEKKREEDLQYLVEKILSRVEELDSKILKGVEALLEPLVAMKETVATIEPETLPTATATAAAAESGFMAELLGDVESLKNEMEDADWKHPPADVIDELISDVRDLKQAREQKLEAMTQTEGSFNQLESQTKAKLVAIREEIDELKKEVKLISSNLGNLFTFVFAKEHGKSMRLKGGWIEERFVIQALKPKST